MIIILMLGIVTKRCTHLIIYLLARLPFNFMIQLDIPLVVNEDKK